MSSRASTASGERRTTARMSGRLSRASAPQSSSSGASGSVLTSSARSSPQPAGRQRLRPRGILQLCWSCWTSARSTTT
eukprot:9329963-Alexandrium_andersonii.AAC.1